METEKKLDTLDYILDKFKLDLAGNTPMPIQIPDFDREQLAILFSELDFKIGAEIGVHRGGYSETLVKNNPGLKLYGVDPYLAYDQYNDQAKVNKYYEEAKLKLSKYDYEFILQPSLDAVNKFENESLDFIYIDGNHDFDNVTADLNAWSEKVRVGGIISGHDFIRFRSEDHAVVRAVVSYTDKHNIRPYFVLGLNAKLPNLKRDNYRSFMWVKL